MRLVLFGFLACFVTVPSWAVEVCPTDAIFLALGDQVRGFPLRANGPTVPCQTLQGVNTGLQTARSIVFSKNGYFHIAQFLTDGNVDIFAPNAAGNIAPVRSFMFPTNDFASNAVDLRLNDFVLSVRGPDNPILTAPAGSTGVVIKPIFISDPNLIRYVAVTTDNDGNLVVGGYDAEGATRIDTFDTSKGLAAPSILRSVVGSATGLLSAASGSYAGNNMTLAVDPETNELYVYNTNADLSKIQVSVFAAHANGNLTPMRVIRGSETGITVPGFVGAGKISVSSDGRLFVAEPRNRILVFALGATGNVRPSQIIEDSMLGPGPTDQGGIAVRSCSCR